MNAILRSCALATLFSLTIATTAKAAKPSSPPISNTYQIRSAGILIAEDTGTIDEQQFKQIRMVNEMIMQYLKMNDMAMQALESSNPEVRKMAQETLTNSNAMVERLMIMRKATVANPRGRN